MATGGDDPKKKEQDSKLVSQQDHEIGYLVKTTGKSRQQVIDAIKQHGPSRAAVLKALGK
jgi:hypothetical protein